MSRRSESLRADNWLLKKRLAEHGLDAEREVEVHENHRVMVSVSARGVLRLHRGYAYAGDHILKAVVVFITPGIRKAETKTARRILLDFPVEAYSKRVQVRKRLPYIYRPEDATDISRLERLHSELNELHFASSLHRVPLRISHRMKRKLGEITLDGNSQPGVITIGRLHIDRDGWTQVMATLLHEMVHQWQAESGITVDHGKKFHSKAIEVGIPASASRRVSRQRKTE